MSTTSFAITVPFTEHFSSNNSNWGLASSPSTNYIPSTWVSSGGLDGTGDGYITSLHTLTSATTGQVIFRGQGNFDSSADKYVGNWLTSNVTELSYWVRHTGPDSLNFGARFAVNANSPGVSIIQNTLVAPNVWTQVTIPIHNGALPGYTFTQEGGTYNGVFSALSNIQILAERGTLSTGAQLTIDVDRVAILPEPSTWVMTIVGFVGTMMMITWRRWRTPAAAGMARGK